jgi:PmbA protein
MKAPAGKKTSEMLGLAESLVAFGKSSGADEVEIHISEGTEFNVDVRLGKIENLIEAGSKALGLRVIKDKKTAFASSSDLSLATLHRLLRRAVKRADLANLDEFAGLAPVSPKKIDIAGLRLFDPSIASLDSKTKIRLALETEKIALQDKRITNSYGASFVTNEIRTVIANSNGFSGEYDQTYCGLSLGLQAGDTDNLVEDYWFSSKRHFNELDPPEKVARAAVERTVRQINPRKIKTQKAPVIFEPTMTGWVLGFLFGCASGISIYQKASFLVDKLGQRIGNENVTVFDDGLLPGQLGTRPFDSDGEACRKTAVVEKGILKSYLCNTYAARKLRLGSTGNADGSSVSPTNLYLQAGSTAPKDIISSTEKGLLLIRTLGHGLNPVTGDISRGAFGLWIENGEIAFPVSEITISGNLGEVLQNVEMVGSDLEFLSPISGPTIKIKEMMIAGS